MLPKQEIFHLSEQLRAGTAADPALAYERLIRLHTAQREYSAAYEVFQDARRNGVTDNNLRIALLETQRQERADHGEALSPEQSLTLARLLYKRSPTNEAGVALGEAYYQIGDFEGAIRALQSTKPSPDLIMREVLLGKCFLQQRYYTTAEKCLRMAQRKVGDDPDFFNEINYYLARVYIERNDLGDRERALEQLVVVLAFNMSYANARVLYTQLGPIMSSHGQLDFTNELLPEFSDVTEGVDFAGLQEQVARFGSVSHEDQYRYGVTLLRAGKAEQALPFLQLATLSRSIVVSDKASFFAALVIAGELGFPQVGAKILDDLHDRKRRTMSDDVLDYYRGEVYRLCGDPRSALEHHSEVIRKNISFRAAREKAAQIQAQMGWR